MDVKAISSGKKHQTRLSIKCTAYLLVVKVLATKLRKNVEWGLKIKVNGQNKVIQISQLADDTTLFFTNEEAIINGLKW